VQIADWSAVRRHAEITVFNDLYRTFYGDAAANIAKWIEVNATSA
jgi:hypothetical protein